ncbi:hypothetical protein OAA90_05230 [Salibacteraceae bacterium]|nr:hypothetical protein [Salibacteraceae bacterium]
MNKLLSALCVIALLSCKNSEKKATIEGTKSEVSEASKKGLKSISFSVKIIQPYCGGAAPSDEMENERMKGEPAKEFVFYISTDGGSPLKLTTNMEGTANAEFPTGSYCIKEGYKSDPEMIKSLTNSDWEFDEECYANWKAQCNQTFVVSDTTSNNVFFEYRPRCGWEGPVPCITNTGFPPP